MFFKKTAQPEALQMAFKLLAFVGLHGSNRIWRYYFTVGWLVGNFILPKVLFGPDVEDFATVTRFLAELIFFVEVCTAVGIFVSRRKSFEQLVQLLREIFERYETHECVSEIRRYNRRMDTFVKVYSAFMMLLVTMFCIPPIVLTLYSTISPDQRSNYVLLAEMQYYYLDIRRNIVHYLIYYVCCVGAAICSAYLSCIKGAVYLTPLQYGSKLFELLHLRINGLGTVEAGKMRHNEVREIIELHNMTLRYVELLEEIVTLTLINQIVNCMLIWCLIMAYFSSYLGPDVLKAMVLFIVLVVEMVVYCVYGTRLSENALNISNALYNYPWYQESVAMQRDIRFMIQRAQKPCGVTAAKFYYVNIERLGIVAQASYSYYLILMNRY